MPTLLPAKQAYFVLAKALAEQGRQGYGAGDHNGYIKASISFHIYRSYGTKVFFI